jgi:peroxisomal 2,4-dienoyl-CoA reductase
MTRSLALEWGSDGIRVNGIAPGPIEGTPGMTKLSPGIDKEDMDEMVAEGIPIGRMGRAFDIGMASVFLSSEGGGSYVTGDVLVVDGGQWLYKPPMLPKEMVADISRKVEGKSRAQEPTLSKL